MGEIVVLITATSEDEAGKLGGLLVEHRLAACVNIVPRVRSIFQWEGRIDEAQESLMIVKSTSEAYNGLEDMVKAHHSYSVPEIIALPIHRGAEDYLAWVRNVVQSKP